MMNFSTSQFFLKYLDTNERVHVKSIDFIQIGSGSSSWSMWICVIEYLKESMNLEVTVLVLIF